MFRPIIRAWSYCKWRVHRVVDRFAPWLIPSGHGDNHREASSLLERGRKLYNQKDYTAAEEYFRRSLSEDTRYVRAHYFLGLVLYKQNDSNGAVSAWKRAVEINPSDSYGAKAQGKLHYVEGHVSRTISELEDRLDR